MKWPTGSGAMGDSLQLKPGRSWTWGWTRLAQNLLLPRAPCASSGRNQVTPPACLVCRIRVSMRWPRCGHLPCLSLMNSVFRID